MNTDSKRRIRAGARRGALAAARTKRRRKAHELRREAERTTDQARLDQIAYEICELESKEDRPL